MRKKLSPRSAQPTLIFEASSKHSKVAHGRANKGPTQGQASLENSIQVKESSPRRVGIDPVTKEFVVFSRTINNIYHAHVRSWEELDEQMQRCLIEHGMATKSG